MQQSFKNILITGANRGIGLEFVRQYAAEADKIYACCRTPENAQKLHALAQRHKNLHILPLDVTRPKHIKALQQQLFDQPLDLLINNAGIFPNRNAALNREDWLRTFAVNSMAPLYMSRALQENLSRSNRAVIANITSKMGSISDNTSGGAIIYRASKAALNAAIKSFAHDSADAGITSLLLHPGWVQTDMGGRQALIDVQTSVSGMRQTIAQATPSDNGAFLNYTGVPIPW